MANFIAQYRQARLSSYLLTVPKVTVCGRVGKMYRHSGLSRVAYKEDGSRRPVITAAIVALNVSVWGILELFGDTLDGAYIAKYGGLYPDFLIYDNEWYRLFTAMFLHFGAQHLANNMVILAAAGCRLEEAAGPFRYLLIYLGAGVTGNIISLYRMLKERDYAVCAGASGAVFGVIGALVWVALRSRGKFEGLTVRGLLFMVALCLYYGITTIGVDNWAHIGGAAGGCFLCILFYRKP